MKENCYKQKMRPGRRRRKMPVTKHALVFASFVSLLWVSEGAKLNQPVAFITTNVLLPSRTTDSSLNIQQTVHSPKLSLPKLLSSQNDNLDHSINEQSDISALKSIENQNDVVPESGRQKIRRKVRDLAKSVSLNGSIQKTKAASAAAMFMPQAVAAIIRDATKSAVEMALDEIMPRLSLQSTSSDSDSTSSRVSSKDLRINTILDAKRIDSLLDEAFLPMEKSLEEMEISLKKARSSLEAAKQEAKVAMQQIQTAVLDQATASTVAVVVDQQQKQLQQANNEMIDTKTASYDDIDYANSEMAPPFLDEDQCLVPGEPVVRVEKAPENSRRIFAGIDILASVDTVWNVLTDYGNLQNVVPNLVVNEVLELYNYDKTDDNTTQQISDAELSRLSEEEQCRIICERMKGSKLRQVGGAKVAGIQFSARTTLEVREWPNGMPDYAHFTDDVYEGKNRMNRAKEYTKIPLERYRFPRPFAISKLPTKDISMQSILNDDGEFRMYQGVWRMQPLVGCAPPGQEAMRLTYAVQISPRSYLPVGLIEGRIVRDLCNNLIAIRDYVASIENTKTGATSPKSSTSKQTSLANK